MYTLEQALTLINRPERARSLVITDATASDHPIVYVSQAFLDATGYRQEDVAGRNPRFLQGPDTDPAETARIAKAIADERRVRSTLVNYRADGMAFLHDITIRPSYDEHGRLEHFIAIQQVLTERDDREDAA